jgi:copper oxidase (laccase) domain-containing protein
VSASGPQKMDQRALIENHARNAGLEAITTSEWSTRFENARFFSHRAGDAGRQLGEIVARTETPRVDSP